MTASLSGTNSTSFTLSTTSIYSIAAGGTSSFTVVPKTALAAGTYTATVTVSGGNGIMASFNVSFTVGAPLVNAATPSITGQPASTTYTMYYPVTPLSVTATRSDGGTLSYQWYQNTSNSTDGGTPIGTNNTVYTPNTSVTGTLYYYVVVTNTNNSATGAKTATATSSVATVTVNAPADAYTPSIIVPPTGATYMQNAPAAALTVLAATLDGGTLSYKWYKNTSNSTTGGTLVITYDHYTPDTSATGTFYYYVVVTNTNNSVNGTKTATATSSVAAVTVTKVTTVGNVITAGSTASAADVKAALTAYLSAASGGGSAANPVVVKINVTGLSQLTEGSDGIGALFTANTAGKYVSYDLSGSTLTTISGISSSHGSNAGKLVSVTLPNSLTAIGEFAFYGCGGLTAVTIPDGVTSIDGNAFSQSGLTSVAIPYGVTAIGRNAFDLCRGLLSVTIPSSVISIGDSAFYGCGGLTSVAIPDSVTSIGEFAFAACSGLTSVAIPDSVTSIGEFAFNLCSGLTSITVDSGNTNYKSIDGVLFNKEGTFLVEYPEGKTGAYTIPNGVTSISSTFINYSGLTSVTIPNSFTSIVGYTFAACSGLLSVTIPNSVTSIGAGAFEDCSGLTSVTIPNSVNYIYSDAFNGCSGLTSVIMPAGVSVDYGAFPQGSYGIGGNALKTAYQTGGAGTYTRAANGSTWTKQ